MLLVGGKLPWTSISGLSEEGKLRKAVSLEAEMATCCDDDQRFTWMT